MSTDDAATEHQRHSTHRLIRSSAIIGIGTALSRVTGFLRIAAIAYALGVTTMAGVYSYANETPNIVYELLLGGILTATLVPQFVRHLQSRDTKATSQIVTVALLALLGITVLGEILAPWIIDIYTLRVTGPGLAEQQAAATSLLRLFMPQMFFYGFTALATALLHARRKFAAAAFAPILNNVVVIAIFLALPQIINGPITVERVNNDKGLLVLLGLGTTAGIVAMALALTPALVRSGVRLSFLPAFKSAAVRTVVRLSGWTVGYVVANQVALAVVLILANSRPGGAFAYLAAFAFFQLPHGLFTVSVTTAVAPDLAAASGRGDTPGFRHRFARALRLTLTVVIPSAVVLLVLAQPIVVALLQRAAFTARDAALVGDTLAGFAIGLPFFSTYLFALRGFYSLSDTRTPFFLNCFENAVNIVLAIVLYDAYGIPGLALAFSMAYALASVLTLSVLSRRLGGLRGRNIGATTGRVLIVSLVAGAGAWGVSQAIGYSSAAPALMTVVVGLAVAAGVVVVGFWALRIKEFQELVRLRRRRRGGTATPNLPR